MTHGDVVSISNTYLLPAIVERYGLEGASCIEPVPAHEGGRNVFYRCSMEGDNDRMIRIAYLPDRNREDLLGEIEYIRYLVDHGANVADVLPAQDGSLLVEMDHDGHTYYVCLFKKARGILLVDNQYRYRKGAPLSEYFYNSGKTLGKIHQLSKQFAPVHPRSDFSDRFNLAYLDRLLPDSLSVLKRKMGDLLTALTGLDKSAANYGMVHFDYSDGNYTIDFETGDITVFDFDNACFCWYLYDLATLWTHGVGWVQFEPDANKRRDFMKSYFDTILEGYVSETPLDPEMLDRLPLFIDVTIMENIVDACEVMRREGGSLACDEELSYLIRCLEEDIPYEGFFDPIYSSEEPFTAEPRDL